MKSRHLIFFLCACLYPWHFSYAEKQQCVSTDCDNTVYECTDPKNCQMICQSADSCDGTTWVCPSSTNTDAICEVQCKNSGTCNNLIVISNRPVNIKCTDVNACTNVLVVANPSADNTNKDSTIACDSDNTCTGLEYYCGDESLGCAITCGGIDSCYGVDYTCDTRNGCTLDCNIDGTCLNGILTCDKTAVGCDCTGFCVNTTTLDPEPTENPTQYPTQFPSNAPTTAPTMPTYTPTAPSSAPTTQPTVPTTSPSVVPTESPNVNPTANPTATTEYPTAMPTTNPTLPTTSPSAYPTANPTLPTNTPTTVPTETPTDSTPAPTATPTDEPTTEPSAYPTANPTEEFWGTTQDNSDDENGEDESFGFNLLSGSNYGIFTILFGVVLLFGCVVVTRLCFIGFFGPENRNDPVALVFIIFLVDCLYQFVTSLVVSLEGKNDGSSVRFYLFTSFIPLMLHTILLFIVIVYYNKFFHKEKLMTLFRCGRREPPPLSTIIIFFSAGVAGFSMLVVMITLAIDPDDALTLLILSIDLFSMIGLLSAALCTGLVIRDWCATEERSHNLKLLMIFAGMSCFLCVLIFLFHLYIAIVWNGDRDDVRDIRVAQLVSELVLFLFVICVLTYIHKEIILIESTEPSSTKASIEVAHTTGAKKSPEVAATDAKARSISPPPNSNTVTSSQAGKMDESTTSFNDSECVSPPPPIHSGLEAVKSTSSFPGLSETPSYAAQPSGGPKDKHKAFTMTPKTQAAVSTLGKQEFTKLTPTTTNPQSDSDLPSPPKRRPLSTRASESAARSASPPIPTRGLKVSKHRSKTAGDLVEAHMLYSKGDKVSVWDDTKETWYVGDVARTEQKGRLITVRLTEVKSGPPFRKIDLGATPENIHHLDEIVSPSASTRDKRDSSRVDLVKRRSKMRPPPSIGDFMSNKSRKKHLSERPLPTAPEFGTEPALLQSTKTPHYDTPLPNVLLMIRGRLKEFSALTTEGIFCNGDPSNIENDPSKLRLAVAEADVMKYQSMVETGQIDTFDFSELPSDFCAHVFAELLKRWLVTLPTPLLQKLDENTFESAVKAKRFNLGARLHNKIPPMNETIFYWLLDLCNAISDYNPKNQMDGHILGQCFGPLLYRAEKSADQEALTEHVAMFFEDGLDHRREAGETFHWE